MYSRRRSSNKGIVIALIILLLLVGGGAYYFISQMNSAEERTHVTITLDLHGGIFNTTPAGVRYTNGEYTMSVERYRPISNLPTPTRTEFLFLGWYLDDGTQIADGRIINQQDDFTMHARWQDTVTYAYTVNYVAYDLDTGVSTPLDSVECDPVLRNEVVSPQIQNFIGYKYYEGDETTPVRSDVQKAIATADTVLTVYYTPNVYNIIYTISGNSVPYAETTPLKYTGSAQLLDIADIQANDSRFDVPYRSFSHWETADGIRLENGDTIDYTRLEEFGCDLDLTDGGQDSITLIAVYGEAVYDLTFISQGTEFDTGKYSEGDTVIAPSNPGPLGYEFVGWFEQDTGATGTNIAGLTPIDFGTYVMPNGVTTLYAGFNLIHYNLTINLSGGHYTDASNPSTYTIEDNFILAKPTLDGYNFIGWTGTDLDQYTINVTISNMTGDREYTAHFSAEPYTISYDYNGGALPDGEFNPASYDATSAEIILINPTKEHYNFIGWLGTDLGSTPVPNVVIPTGSMGNRSYEAIFEAIEYDIIYTNMDGAEFPSGNKTTYTVEDSDYRVPTPTKDGYTFDGWTVNADPTPTTDLTLDFSNLGGDIELTANWTLTVYEITYDIGEGSIAEGNPTEYTILTPTFTIDIEPTLGGYDFIGWTGSNGITPQKNITITQGTTGDLHYVANYGVETYTITYHLDGGQNHSNNPGTYTSNNYDITLRPPTKVGYTFAGWSGTDIEDGTYPLTVTIYSGSSGDREYTAHWTPNTDTDYKIEIYLMTAEGRYGTSPDDTLNREGTTDTQVTYTPEAIDYYVTPSAITDTIAPDGSMVIKCYYARQTYSVSVSGDEGISSVTGNAAGRYWGTTITVTAVVKTGYEFVAWTSTNSGLGGATTSYQFEMPRENVTLTATSNILTYTIEYTLNSGQWPGDGTNPNPTSYNVNTATFTLVEPVREGWTFTGWTGSNGNQPQTNISIPLGSVGDRQYRANWVENTVNITVNHYQENLNGTYPTSPTDTETIQAKTNETITPPVKTYTGFDSPSPQEVVVDGSGDKVVEYRYTRQKFEVTVTARTGVTNISYSTNDTSAQISSSGGTITFTIKYGAQLELTPTFAENFKFDRWELDGSPMDTQGQSEITYIADEGRNVALAIYASGEDFSITYDLNDDGTNTATNNRLNPDSFTYGSSLTIYQPSRPGYTFMGWEVVGSDPLIFGTTINVGTAQAASITVRAWWGESTSNFGYSLVTDSDRADIAVHAATRALSGVVDLPEFVYTGNIDLPLLESNLYSMFTAYVVDKDFYDLGVANTHRCTVIGFFQNTGNRQTAGITGFNIPQSYNTIYRTAFYGCTGLTSITVPSHITNIGQGAFYRCSSLTFADLSNTPITVLDISTFAYCINLVEVKLPNTLTEIGNSAFANCSNLTVLTLPTSLVSIGNFAFTYAEKLPDSILSASLTNLTTIGEYAFQNCRRLYSVTIPRNVTSIGTAAFNVDYWLRQIRNLSTVSLNDTKIEELMGGIDTKTSDIEVITGNSASFTTVIYRNSNGVITIDDNNNTGDTSTGTQTLLAYEGTNPYLDLTDMTDLYSVGYAAFMYNDVVRTIKLPETIDRLRALCFARVPNLMRVEWIRTDLNTMIIDNMGSLGGWFVGSTKLVQIAWPYCDWIKDNPTWLPDNPGLENIEYGQSYSNTLTQSGDYWTYTFGGHTYLIAYTGNATSVDFSSYGNYVYSGVLAANATVESVTLSSSLTQIPSYAFYRCVNLSDITLPEGVTSIGDHAFSQCYVLSTINLPDGINDLGEGTFDLCIDLNNIVVPSNVSVLKSEVFRCCFALTDQGFSIAGVSDGTSKLTKILSRAFQGTNLTTMLVPNGTQYHQDAFYESESFVVPSNMTLVNDLTE